MSEQEEKEVTVKGRPLPPITKEDKPYFDATKKHELRIPMCKDCGTKFMPPQPICPTCLSENLDWIKTSGRGKVIASVIFNQPMDRNWTDVPYNVIQVQLEEGPRLTSRMVKEEGGKMVVVRSEAECRPGTPVEVVFEDLTPEITLPNFKAR